MITSEEGLVTFKSQKLNTVELLRTVNPLNKTEKIFFNCNLIYLSIYFGLCWVFVAVQELSLVVASRGYSSSQVTGFSLQRLLLLQSPGSRRVCSVATQ